MIYKIENNLMKTLIRNYSLLKFKCYVGCLLSVISIFPMTVLISFSNRCSLLDSNLSLHNN